QQINGGPFLFVVNDLVDAAIAAVVAVHARVVALVFVIPVDDEDRAVLVISLVKSLAPRVVEVEEILAVFTHKTGAAALRDVHVETLAVDVADKKLAAEFRGPGLAEVTQHARVCVAPT